MYSTKAEDLIGKTITEIYQIRAEYGRTYNYYLGFVCEDGARVLTPGQLNPYKPDPSLSEMRKSKFFTPEERKNSTRGKKQERIKEAQKREFNEYMKLKRKFEGVNVYDNA